MRYNSKSRKNKSLEIDIYDILNNYELTETEQDKIVSDMLDTIRLHLEANTNTYIDAVLE
ncbi:MAG: hypothetical protein M0R06_00400 [Sphaerochaeta sp.]|nr:hypothetical protein [Sphaerochaeta sp.]